MRALCVLMMACGIAGCAASQTGGPDGAASAATPGGAEALMNAARAASQRADYDEAIRLYTRAIETGKLADRNQAGSYVGRAMAHGRKGEFDAEISDCNAAIRLWPNSPQAYVNRAYAYDVQKAYDLAFADLEVAIQLQPDNAYSYDLRGTVYLNKRQPDLAIASYDEAIRIKPDYADAYLRRAAAYRRNKQFDRAMTDLDEAIRLKPDYAEAYDLRAVLFSYDERYDAAMADFATSIRLKPNSPSPYAARGMREFTRGQLTEAAADFERETQLAPATGSGALWLHLTRVRAGVDDGDEFTRNLAKVDRSKWPNPVLALYHGEITPEETRSAVAADEPDRSDQLCQVDFYIGEYELLRHAAAAAKPLLERAADRCPAHLRERFAARAELERMARGK